MGWTPTHPAILVWRWADAPDELRALSGHGGDEDWVAVLPPGTERPQWADSGTAFGVCDTEAHEFPDFTVLIGAHS